MVRQMVGSGTDAEGLPQQEGPQDYELSVLQALDNSPRRKLILRFLEYRKEIFIDRMEWPLFHHEGAEFEQYDSIFDTIYVIAHRGDKIIGGARLRRTDATLGQYSYMIRDACLGLLRGMPSNLCDEEPPVDHDVWELTRFAANLEPGLAESILRKSNDYLFDQGAKDCLFLGPPAFMRMARKLGWDPKPMGPIAGNADGRFLAFKCAIVPPLSH